MFQSFTLLFYLDCHVDHEKDIDQGDLGSRLSSIVFQILVRNLSPTSQDALGPVTLAKVALHNSSVRSTKHSPGVELHLEWQPEMLEVCWTDRGRMSDSIPVKLVISRISGKPGNHTTTTLLLHGQHPVRKSDAIASSKEKLEPSKRNICESCIIFYCLTITYQKGGPSCTRDVPITLLRDLLVSLNNY